MSAKSPFTTAFLASLPKHAYAYRNASGVWSIRNGMTYAQATTDANARTEQKANEAWQNAIGFTARRDNAEATYNG